jgi:uncharacterized RDD family membrane protein YckC
MLAFLLDLMLRGAIYFVAAMPLACLGETGIGLLLLLMFALEWFYPVYFEVWRRGATPGKRSLGLQVVHHDGTTVGLPASLLRNLMRFADFLPVAYGLGLLFMTFDKDFRRLGDLAAGTLVVYREASPQAPKAAAIEPLLPAFPLTQEDQLAIVSFSERAPQWTAERAAELATLARPLTGLREAASVSALHGIAAWIRSRR